jgi:hypothetical protein
MVLAATCGFPDLENFKIVRELFPYALHILLPASQILFNDKGRKYLSEFLDDVKLSSYTMASGKDIPRPLTERLIVDYPTDVKKTSLRFITCTVPPRPIE